MTDEKKYERLTDKNDLYWALQETKLSAEVGIYLTDCLNLLAELEDKIENGTLIELPCKVGDRIWAILGNNIFGRKVKSIVIRGDGYTIKTSNTNGWKDLEPYYNTEFGVIWFLTKAEAEQRLKELQND